MPSSSSCTLIILSDPEEGSCRRSDGILPPNFVHVIKGGGFPDAAQENVTRPFSVTVLLTGLTIKTGSVGGSGKCHETIYHTSWNNSVVMR